MIIRPAKRISGRLEMPGDKSISHRAAMIAALANGTSRITNFSTSEDCAATLRCLGELGVSITRENNDLVVQGVGTRGLRKPSGPLDCGNSGTTMRLLAGILAGQNFEATLTGDESLRSRPMQRIIEPLELMGARISSTDGRAPLTIRGRYPLQAIDYELPVSSAQVKSAILLAGLNAKGQTKIIQNASTRDHTERILSWFGVHVTLDENRFEGQFSNALSGPATFSAADFGVPGDISSAAYFIAAAALLDGSSLEIVNLGINDSRTAYLSLLMMMGLTVRFEERREESDESNEPVGIVSVEGANEEIKTRGRLTSIESGIVATAIDELPLLAVVGSQFNGGIEMCDARELRLKESDRIAATVAGLRAMGADVEEWEYGFRVGGPTRLRGARIDPRGDHRIAMTFAIAGLIADGETEIMDADCVRVSFPEFFDLLDSVVER